MAALRTSPRARRTLTTVTAAGCLLLGTAAAANAAPKADLSPPKVLSAENSRGEALFVTTAAPLPCGLRL